MDKLQYDSVYKFLVSLGVIIIVLPFVIIIYLLDRDVQLISKLDFYRLSKFSQQAIYERERLVGICAKAFPVVFVVFEVVGIFLVKYGVKKWFPVQKDLDMKIKAEAVANSLNAMKMSSSRVVSKFASEVGENGSIEDGNQTSNLKTSMIKHAQVEDACFEYISSRYARKYRFERNIRMGQWEYDFVGIANKSNVDLIFEIKYWQSMRSGDVLRRLCQTTWDACVYYETSVHRNFKCIIVLVMPEKDLLRTKKSIETLFSSPNKLSVGNMEFWCMSEMNMQSGDYCFEILKV